jgi:D-glycerate 3-kinase
MTSTAKSDPPPLDGVVATFLAAVRAARPAHVGRPLALGLCGSQGSGKSTLSAKVADALAAEGLSCAILALDDLYLPRAAREDLARIHPLLRTRGVPGTHDVALGLEILAGLGRPGRVAMPRFDKARDDRRPRGEWDAVEAPVDVVVFEGWCVGARPQALGELAAPVNALERECDPDGVWRRWANAELAGRYQDLFARVDLLAFLAAPDFSVVAGWRREQEDALRQRLSREGRDASTTLDDPAVDRFVQHYQRLTEHMLREMPARADIVVRLDPRRVVLETQVR